MITCFDATVGRAGVPFVDCRVVLDAGVGALPGGERDLLPKIGGRDDLILLVPPSPYFERRGIRIPRLIGV